MKSGRLDHTLPLFKKLNILPVNSLYVYNMLVNIYKIRNELLPEIFTVNFKINRNLVTRNTRQQDLYFILIHISYFKLILALEPLKEL